MSFLRKFNQALIQEGSASFNFCEIIKKIFCFLLIVICIGLPINNIFSFTVIFISGLLIVNGEIKRSFRRLIFVFLIATAIFLIKGVFPHVALQEGHNIFLLTEDKGALERGLPPEVFSFMKQQFLQRYPSDNQKRIPPQSLFSFSTDSIFSKPKYSRIVDSINFNNLVEFRGSFVNNTDYNWYGDSVIKRESMPFFVMYELSPSSVGSRLCWTGYVLWEDSWNHYQSIYNQAKNCRKITNADVGKKIFCIAINNKEQMGFGDRLNALKFKFKSFFHAQNTAALDNKKEAYLSVHLILSPFLKLFLVLKIILEILGVLFILNLVIKINWRRFIFAALIIAIAATIVYFYCPELFGQYYIHEGGEDGLTHQTLGRNILTHALSGNWISALRGEEDVFWNTPGFRYFRALEKFFFGDTNFEYLAIILLLPYVLFGFLGNFISKKWAFWVTIIFLLGLFLHPHPFKPNLGFAYYIYVTVARGGWPDALAYTAFLGALTLLLRYVNVRNGGYYWYGFWANFLLFITVFMRPHFAITALIVVIYFATRLVLERRFKEVFLSMLGFTPIVFLLLHNYFFGHKVYLLTGAIDSAVNMPPRVYLNAFKEFLALDFSGQNGIKVIVHLKAMIGPWYRLIFLGAVFYAAFFKRKIPADMRMIAISCLSLHFVSLFIFATYFRYVYLSWALTVVVAIFLVYLLLGGRKELRE